MSSKIKNKRCKRGTKKNPKTGECEPIVKISEKSVEKSVEKDVKKSVKRKTSIFQQLRDVIMSFNPTIIVNQPHNNSIQETLSTQEIPPNEPSQNEPSQNEKFTEEDKKICKTFQPSDSDIIRKEELSKLTGAKLRVIHSELENNPLLIVRTPGIRTKDILINYIICLENKIKKDIISSPKDDDLISIDNDSESIDDDSESINIKSSSLDTDTDSLSVEYNSKPKLIICDPLPEASFDEEEKIDLEQLLKKQEKKKDDTESNTSININTDVTNTKNPITDIELQLQDKIAVAPTDIESKEYNTFLFNKEIIESENLKNNDTITFLYPELNDPNFNIKIAKHKEFNDTKYEGDIYNIKEQANQLCNAEFELFPHQLFVKNFLSMQTPYNCLLLYHSLGTGKTLSSIGIAEEMRAYMKQVGFNQPILIIASPNVQQNFRLQLFDERKLKLVGGLWTLNSSIGNSILKEINPTNLIGIPKDRIISEINSIINKYYHFMGYTELANFIKRHTTIPEGTRFSINEQKQIYIKKIHKYFDNRLIIIDEVHNIRISDDNREESKTATLLMEVARYSNNMRLVLLSATPMYNNYKEIIWLTNLMNTVDKRSIIREDDVFDKDGLFLPEKTSKMGNIIEGGRELLQRKLTGYISYVRGENPYTFPYRIYPETFSPENSLSGALDKKYPSKQLNQRIIENPLTFIPVYIHPIDDYQAKYYDFIINHLRNKSFSITNKLGKIRELPSFENIESFGYTLLMQPLEALNIIFPNQYIDNININNNSNNNLSPEEIYPEEQNEEIIKNIIGKRGLYNVMTCKTEKSPIPNIYDFEYKPSILSDVNHGRIFNPDKIKKYSSKIAKICESIRFSNGIVLIYSQYIEGGVVPIALALEEMGFSRFSTATHVKSLFKTPPTEPLDSLTMKPKSQFLAEGGIEFQQAKYIMITGNKAFSPDNLEDFKYVTNQNNKNGEKVKVIIISKAGSEGLDFKCIRQIHILEPWYNMSRIEQIIGRGVRNFSHCYLDFEERNVEIYLHSTLPRNDEEPADLYVYRFAEKKAVLIGNVTRLLKETSVDCILNIAQTNFTIDKLASIAENKQISLKISSKKNENINYSIGDRPFTQLCDYTDNCSFTCSPNATINQDDIIKNNYNNDFLKMNYSGIVKRIRDLFKEKISFDRDELIHSINVLKTYPISHIDYALSRFIDNKNEYVLDRWGRNGYIINRGKYYIFQPIEITDETISLFERETPIDHKRQFVEIDLPKEKIPLIIEEEGEIIEKVELEENQENITNNYNQIIQKLRLSIENVNTWKINYDDIEEKKRFSSKETDWYINMGYIFNIIIQNHNIDESSLNEFIIYHFLDTISLKERLILVKYLYSLYHETDDIIQKTVKSYFDEKIFKVRGYNIIMLQNDKLAESTEDKLKIFIQDDNKNLIVWNIAQPTDRQEFLKVIIVSLKSTVINKLNRLFGIMQVFTNNNIVFKTIDLQNKLKKGSRCGGEGKRDIMKKINMISSDFKYTEDNTENENLIVKPGLCIILEILLRYYHKQKHNGYAWFLGFENNVFIPK